MTTIVAALIGAFIGSVGATLAEAAIASRADVEKRRQAVATRYLFQLQDAVESLWYRLDNAAHHAAAEVTTDAYLRTSSLYALGRVLCLERVLVLEGVYAELASLDKDLAEYLQREGLLDRAFARIRFMRYDRVALAETLLQREEGSFRPSTYLEFRAHLEELDEKGQRWLTPAEQAVADLLAAPGSMQALLDATEGLARRISAFTGFACSIRHGETARGGAAGTATNMA